MCNTEKIRKQNKTLNTKHYYLKVLYHSLVRGQYLYSRAKPGGIALNYLLYYSFIASLGRRPKRISMVQFLFMKKVNEYYLFLN